MNIDLKSFPNLTTPSAKFYAEVGTLTDTETGTESGTVLGKYRFTPTLVAGYYDYVIEEASVIQSYGAIHVVSDSVYYLADSIEELKSDQATRDSIAVTEPTIVLPVGFLKNINRNTNNALDLYIGETGTYTTLLQDSKGRPVSLDSGTWKIVIKSPVGAEEAYSFQENLTVSGDDDNVVSFDLGTLCDELRPDHEFSIRETTSDLVKLKGICNVRYAP